MAVEEGKVEFTATHRIVITRHDGTREEVLVLAVEGRLYTRGEWDAEESASWIYDGEDGLLFQGATSPYANSTVEIQRLTVVNR